MNLILRVIGAIFVSILTVVHVGHKPTPKKKPSIAVESTAYCLNGKMANGARTAPGDVASNLWPLGTRLSITKSPYGSRTFTVTDRVGWGTQLDFWVSSCSTALVWGRRTVTLNVLS